MNGGANERYLGQRLAFLFGMKNVIVYSVSSILSQGLRVVLSNDFKVSGLFASVEELDDQLRTESPDLLVMDMTPAISFETLRRLTAIAPNTRFILWIDSISPEFVSACLSLGIRGVLSKSASAETHVRCLQDVAAGSLWIDQALSNSLMSTKAIHLTPRERQMIGLLVQGLSNKEVAWAMGIALGTVKVYMSRLFPKVGVADRFDLALLALKNLPGRSVIDDARTREPGKPATPIAFPSTIRISSIPSQPKMMLTQCGRNRSVQGHLILADVSGRVPTPQPTPTSASRRRRNIRLFYRFRSGTGCG